MKLDVVPARRQAGSNILCQANFVQKYETTRKQAREGDRVARRICCRNIAVIPRFSDGCHTGGATSNASEQEGEAYLMVKFPEKGQELELV